MDFFFPTLNDVPGCGKCESSWSVMSLLCTVTDVLPSAVSSIALRSVLGNSHIGSALRLVLFRFLVVRGGVRVLHDCNSRRHISRRRRNRSRLKTRAPSCASGASNTWRSTVATSRLTWACGRGSAWTAWWWSTCCAAAITTPQSSSPNKAGSRCASATPSDFCFFSNQTYNYWN